MKPAAFDYLAPDTVEEAVELLVEHGDEGKVMAGGQSLVPLLNMRLALPTVVVDVGRVAQLRDSADLGEGGVRYGATTVHSWFEDRRVPDPTDGLLHRVAAGIGYRAVRNRGTLGGSLAHADASAEWPVVMAAVDAEVIVQSARGERRIPAADLIEGFFTSALADDELLVAVEVPRLPADVRTGFHKAARKPGEFAESLAVATVGPRGSTVWIGAARPVPLRVDLPMVTGVAGWDTDARAEVAAAVAAALADGDAPGSDDDPDERYRRHLHGVAACRAIDDAIARVPEEDHR